MGAWDPESRVELKYQLDRPQYLRIRDGLAPVMRRDSFTLAAQEQGYPGYHVKSLYYDSDDFSLYGEKLAGDSERRKLRVRAYPLNPAAPVRAELKTRQAARVIKKAAPVSWARYRAFQSVGLWGAQEPVLLEFDRFVCAQALRPQVLVSYYREGYSTREPGDLRVTFDHAVQSVQAKSLLDDPVGYRRHDPRGVVMEIKFGESYPAWLRTMVWQYGLRAVSNSKYAQAVLVSINRFYSPDHVVVIR